MAEELNLTATFDISGLVEGMNRAAASIQEGASRISAALDRASSLSVTSLSAVEGATAAAQASIKALADTYTSSVSAASAFESAETNLASANERVTASAAGLLATIKSENATFAETAVAAAINQRAQSNLITIQESFVVATKAATEAIENLNAKQLQNVESITNLESIVDRLEKAEVDWAAANGLVTASFDELQAAQNAETEALLKYAGVISETQAKEAELAAQQATRAKEAAAAQVAVANETKAAQIAAAEAAETANTKWAASQGIVTESVEDTTGAVVLDSESISGLAGQNEIAAEETLVYDEAIQDLNANMEKQSELLEAQTVAWADSLGIITSEVPAAEAAELALSEANEKYVASLENAEVANAKWAASNDIVTAALADENEAIEINVAAWAEKRAAEEANAATETVSASTAIELGSAIDFLTSKEGQAALASQGLQLNLTKVVVAEEAATAATSNFTGMIGYAAARLISIEAGVGRLGYEFGILARAIPSVSAALSFIFPPLMLFVIFDVVSSLIDKFEKLGETLRKTQVDFDNIATSSEMMGTQIALQTLKIEDQISKLEGGVADNKTKEAILETRLETEKLTKSLEDAIEKTLELLRTDEVTLWRSLVTGLDTTSDLKDHLEGILGAIQLGLGQRELGYERLSAAERRLKEAGDDEAAAAARRDIEQAKLDIATANESVRTNRDKLDVQLKQEQDHINELVRIRTTTQAVPGVRGTGPAFMTTEQALASVSANQAVVTSIETVNTAQRNAEALDRERAARQIELAGLQKDHQEDRVRQFQASLNAMQSGLDAFHTFSTKSIIDFWNNILNTETLTNKEREEIGTKLVELQRRQLSETTRDITSAARDQAATAKTTIDVTTERVQAAQKALDDFNAAQAAAKPTLPGAPAPAAGLEVVVRPDVANERKKLEADLTVAIGAQEQARAIAAIRGIQEQYNEARKGSDERVRLAKQEVDTLEAQARSGTAAAIAAEKQLTEAKKEQSEVRIRLGEEEARHTAEMQIELVNAQRAHYEATTTEDEKRSNAGIDREERYNDKIYEIERTRLEKQLAVLKSNSAATEAQITTTEDKITELKRKHEADRQALEDRRQRDRMALENSVNATLERGIAGAITGMLTNYKNFQSALRGIYDGILADFAAFLAKKVQHWIEHLILEKLWARIFGAQDTGATPADEAKNKIKANTATAQSDAAAAAANTLALDSMVELPPIPEAKALAVYTLGLGLASLSAAAGSFERGGITGSGITPAFLHPREMVLDSRLSEGMQNLILNSGSPAVASRGGVTSSSLGATGGHTFNFPTHIGNLSALDGASVKAALEAHGDTIGKVAVAKVKSYFRSNGVIK